MSKALPATQFVKEGMPPPDLRLGPVGSVYVDNIGTFGFVERLVNQCFDDSVACLESAGFVLHELDRGSVEVVNVGIVIHQNELKIRHTRKRSWRLYLALKYVLRLKKITSEALRVLTGHIVHFFSLQRPGLSTLHHTYKFIYRWPDGRSHVLPSPVKRELRTVVGIIFQVEKDLAAPYADKVYCGDSSSYGFCFQWTPSTAEEQRELFRFHERWRFIEVEEGIGMGLGTHHSWSADIDEPDIAYVRWLRQRLGLPALDSGVLERGSKGTPSCNNNRHFRHFDLVGMVPKLPDSLVVPERWRTVVQRKWKHDEPIHMKEGRVALMSLRRESRSLSSHGKRLLTLCDNLSAVCAFDRGRCKDLSLLSLCRRSLALQLATGIQWHLRYVETARNPSDEGSRSFPPSKHKPLGIKTPNVAGSTPLPSSSCTARLLRQTADFGRGGKSLGKRLRRVGGVDMMSEVNETSPVAGDAASPEEGPRFSKASSSKPPITRLVMQTSAERSAKTRSSMPQIAPSFLELFSGSSRLTSAISMKGLRVAVPFELTNGRCYDLSRRTVQNLIKEWICSGRIWYVHLGTPCTCFSIARSREASGKKYKDAMRCVHFTAEIIRLCVVHGVYFSLENPKTSKMFQIGCIRKALRQADAEFVEYHCCRYGCPYKKPTILATNCLALVPLGKQCSCGKRGHEHLRGRVRLLQADGKFRWFWKTSLAGEYPGELCHYWASLLCNIASPSSFRTRREPQFLSGWQDEICQVTSSILPGSIKIQPCPSKFVSPWEAAVSTWGTGSNSSSEVKTQEGTGH